MTQKLLNDCLDKLQTFLRSKTEKFTAVVMPDFFLDRLINLNWSPKTLAENLEKVAKKKGGSLDGIKQTEIRGGNAINTASALSALGVRTIPIVSTDKLGLELIKFYLKRHPADLAHVKVFEKASITTAMELETENGKINVMLRDVGSLEDFGPQNLDNEDFKIIEDANYVCVFNWAGTRRFGTELAETVFRHAKKKGKAKTYYDTADPTPNAEKIPELAKNVLQSRYLDILSVNENEAVCYASELSGDVRKKGKSLRLDELARESAKTLASHLSARVDLHTTSFCATFTKKGETIAPAFKVSALRATGAGDAWNAGNILGDACKLSDECRLTLANAVAAYYISNPLGTHPTRKQLIDFCDELKGKKHHNVKIIP